MGESSRGTPTGTWLERREHNPEPRILDGRYRLLSLLGKGGMGEVWCAEHVSLGTHVAVKLLLARLVDRADSRGRFLREAKAAASLRGVNVVQVLDHGVDEGTPFIVMELLVGESLGARLRRDKTLAPHDVARIIAGMGRGVGRAHKVGIVHRDLKPDNVFLSKTEDGAEVVKVLDFGIAKLIDAALFDDEVATQTGSVVGTPHYVSPEQARGNKDLDARADLWALAVIAYECLVGSRPFQGAFGELVLKICADPPPVPSLHGEVPPGFDAWFARAVAPDIIDRYQSVDEMVVALEAALAPRPSGSELVPSARRSRSTLFVVGGAVLLAGLLAGMVAAALGSFRSPPASTSASMLGSPSTLRSPLHDLDERAAEGWRREGWFVSGGGAERYIVGEDPREPRGDHFAMAITSRAEPTSLYGVWVRHIPAAPYQGKRVRVSTSTKARGATTRADLWARVQSAKAPVDGAGLFFADAQIGPDSDWTARSFVLDVPANASRIEVGAGLSGPGWVWVDRVEIEAVPEEVPVTGHEQDVELAGWWVWGDAPATLQDGAVHVTVPREHHRLVEIRRVAQTAGARQASCSFEVKSSTVGGSLTCFLGDRYARYSESGDGATTKSIPPTTEGFVRCEVAFEPPPNSAFTVCGLTIRNSGDVWVRGGAVTLK